MMVGTGMAWGFGMGWFAVLFWVFVVAGIAWLVLALARPTKERGHAASTLAERYARGEIDTVEFKARARLIEEASR